MSERTRPTKPTVIFDFDGTIADSLQAVLEVFGQITGVNTKLDDSQLAELRRMPLRALAKHLGIRIWKVPLLLLRGRKLMTARMHEVQPYEGMPQLLADLKNDQYRLLVVSTNSSRNVRKFLYQHGMSTYFTHIYGNAGLFNKGRTLKRVLLRNRLKPQNCVYIGDETRDIRASNDARLRCIAVSWGFDDPELLRAAKPFRVVSSAGELRQAIKAASGPGLSCYNKSI